MSNLREGLSTFEIAEELGLKKDEYEQICSLMGRVEFLTFTKSQYFLQCGLSIVLTNHQGNG